MKINVHNVDGITAALEGVQRDARVRTITARHVEQATEQAVFRVSALLPKAYQTGVMVDIDMHNQAFPANYKGHPMSTQFRIERFPSGWFVTAVWRDDCQGPARRCRLMMSEEQKIKMAEHIIERF